MAKARQQYFADETSLQKDSREFAIADDVQQKIDSIEEGAQVNVIETVKVNGTALTPDANKAVDIDVPDVIDNLYTTSSDDALSANQGKLLYDYIQNLSSRGRFLSNWNAATGLPTTNPSESPYTYRTGDYYIVSNVAPSGGTDYRPNGSQYVIGQASTTVETETVAMSDIYLYDGTNWLLLSNSGRAIAIDSNLSTTSTNPVENRVITNELNKKYYGVVSNAAPSNPTEGMLWYDTANDILKTYDGANWNEAGTQMNILSYGNSTWNDFITAYNKNALVYCRASSNSNPATGTQGRLAFMAYVNNATNPTEVEFQYYRSRSDHNTAANQLDQVFVYKLTSASGGTWTVTERNTAAKAVAGTGINLAFGSGNMTISNTGVTSVNGDTGVVTVNDVKVSAAEPSPHTEGTVWYDTTNDQLKVYDGSQWNITGKEYNAGPGISIGTYNDYSAMRGPCPEGFHVPTEGELDIMANSLISTFGRDPVQDLKMPLTGYRSTANGAVNNQGNEGDYRSVTYEDEVAMMYYLEIGSNSADVYTGTPTGGRAIRPFKDEYISPDNTWTIIQGTLGNAGIFRNQSKGLISITDGSVGYTIADKNLGATQVYNYGDTLSEANCGKYYQRGNNYGFPRTGSVTTSSTLVDASNYGPGNYYSSSTYITNNVGWDSSNNANLRGGETGVVTLDNTITNTGALSVNGQTGDVTIPTPEESNTKTFYLSSRSDLTNAQAAYDWYVAGKNPIISLSDRTYYLIGYSSNPIYLQFCAVNNKASISNNMVTEIDNNCLKISITNSSVSSISEYNNSTGKFLSTENNYSTPYTPQYDGSPTTKKYVDDRDTYIGSSAPTSNLVEGRLWYDTTNDQLKVYDGTNWNVTGAESNTKTFYLAGTTGTTNIATAQAAYDWYAAGKNPIVIYDGANYTYYQVSSSSIYFAGNKYSYSTTSSGTTTQYYYVRFTLSSGTVTGIYTGTYGMGGKYLTTDNTTSYTPSGNYNPATKKYVDDRMATRLEGHIYYLDASETNLGISSDTMGEICGTLDGGAVILMMNISSTYSTMRDGYYYVTKYIEQGDANDTYDIYAVNFGETYEDQICKVHIIITDQMTDASIDEFDVSYVFRSDDSASGKTLVKNGTAVNSYGWQRPGAYDNTTAPASPSRGTLWRDRTNNVVKLYNGSSWQTYYPSNAPIQVVSSLPATPDANTIYIVK